MFVPDGILCLWRQFKLIFVEKLTGGTGIIRLGPEMNKEVIMVVHIKSNAISLL